MQSEIRNPQSAIPALLLALLCTAPLARAADLQFRPAGDGVFAFDTGEFRGKLTAAPNSQGVISLVDSKTRKELTKGQAAYGVFSFYRLLATDHRFGAVAWDWPKQGTILPDGALQITWPGQDDHPIDLTAVYRWTAPGTLDLEASAKPARDVPKFEVFLASYFADAFRSQVYLKPALHADGQPALVPVEVNPLIVGTYLSFPRDRTAAQMIYDGRWDKGLHPVHWSVTHHMAGPLITQHDRETGITCALMARPEDCFAINVPYNMDPADGVANHHSAYFSLFGKDINAGETVRARLRLVIGKDLKPEKPIEAYRAFAEGK